MGLCLLVYTLGQRLLRQNLPTNKFDSKKSVQMFLVFLLTIIGETNAFGRLIYLTKSLANHNCQVTNGIKSLHRWHCSGVLNFGTVQCQVCLALAIPVQGWQQVCRQVQR